LAVNTAEVAIPDEFVMAVFVPPENVPEAPLLGAVNVTVTPLTAFPFESSTVATRELANARPTVAVCGVPLVAAIEAGLPVVCVTVKLYVVETEGATKVRGFAVDPSPQLSKTYGLDGDTCTVQLAPAVHGSVVGVM